MRLVLIDALNGLAGAFSQGVRGGALRAAAIAAAAIGDASRDRHWVQRMI
jgi:hypothetical protein